MLAQIESMFLAESVDGISKLMSGESEGASGLSRKKKPLSTPFNDSI